MAANPQPFLRRVRLPGQDAPSTHADGQSPLAVLYLPARVRDRVLVRDRLTKAGALVTVADDVPGALQALGARRFGLVVVDLATERTSIAAVRLICAQFPAVPVIGLMDTTQPLVASEAIYAGATDLLPWPFDERDVAIVFAAARDAVAVDPSPAAPGATERLFEYSASMRMVSAGLKSAASRRTAVLISGEDGSGRQLVARTLHERDHDYVTRPLAMVDCAAEGPNELERRLFGAVTDHDAASGLAVQATRTSAVIAAQGGSLLLLNVVDAPARIQTRLAQLLRDREVFSVDLQETIPLDFRPIAVAGPDVDEAMADGRLRRDLFERLAQVRVDMPPLRRRREDVPLLAAYFLKRACDTEGGGFETLQPIGAGPAGRAAVAGERERVARRGHRGREGHVTARHPARERAGAREPRRRAQRARRRRDDAAGSPRALRARVHQRHAHPAQRPRG